MTQSDDGWYFIGTDGTQFGPYPRTVLAAMRQSGQIGELDLVWSPGMDVWQPYNVVLPAPVPAAITPPEVAIEPAPVELPPLPPPSNVAGDGETHPWRRYFAKLIDVFLFGFLAVMVAAVAVSAASPDRMDALVSTMENQYIATVVVLGAWVPIDAFALSVFGTTPGRSLFGILVRDRQGDVLTFDKSLERSARVVVQGLAGGLPFLTLVTHWFAYRRLTTTGTTLWDEAVGAVVTHTPWGPGRTVACALAAAVILLALAIVGMLAMGT